MKPLSQYQQNNLAKVVMKHGMKNLMSALFHIAVNQSRYWHAYNKTAEEPDEGKFLDWENTAIRLHNANEKPWLSDEKGD